MAYDGNKAVNGNGLLYFWTQVKSWIKAIVSPKQDHNIGSEKGGKTLVTDSDGNITASGVTSEQLGRLSGVTSDVQTQLDGKMLRNVTIGTSTASSTISTTEVKVSDQGNVKPSADADHQGYFKLDVAAATDTTAGISKVGAVVDWSGSSSPLHKDVVEKDSNTDRLLIKAATKSTFGVVKVGDNISVNASVGNADYGTISVPAASSTVPGVVKLGASSPVSSNVRLVGVNASGQLAVSVEDTDISGKQDNITVGTAAAGAVTTISAGPNIAIDIAGGTATVKGTYAYSLPVATGSALGGVKGGATVSISDDGTLNVATNSTTLREGLLQTASEPGMVYLSTSKSTSDSPYVGYHAGYVNSQLDLKAPLADPDFTGTPKISGSAIATQAYVDSAVTGAQTFKGVLSSNAALKAVTSFTAGWYWRIGAAGTYAGHVCEVGDMIFCVVTHTKTASADLTKENFSVVQNNVDFLTNTEIQEIINAVA